MSAYAAFQSRNYRFLLAGVTLSNLGQQMLAVVVGWDLYLATRSALVLGNVGLAQVIPVFLFTFFAGHVADHAPRKRTILITQTCSAIIGFLLAIAGEARGVALIYAGLVGMSMARTFQWPVGMALLPQTVPRETLTNAVSWNGTARELATVVGPAIAGGLIAAVGSESVYLAQAACSVVSCFCYMRLDVPHVAAATKKQPGLKATLEGLKFVWNEKVILSAISLDLFAVLFGGAVALLPIYAEEILNIGATGLGYLRAAPAVGAGLMSLYLAHNSFVKNAGWVLLASVAGFGVATMIFAVSTNVYLSFAMLFTLGALDAVSVVLRLSVVQLRTPDPLRGRVSAVKALFISSSNQWGAVESGVAAELMGVVPSVVFGGAMTVLVVIGIGWASKSLREWKN